jgi:hypothetical protein
MVPPLYLSRICRGVVQLSPAAGEPTCVNTLATLVKSYAELFVNAPSVG